MKRRDKVGIAVAAAAAVGLIGVWLKRLLGRRASPDRDEVKERMVAPLAEAERSAPAATPEAFVDPEQR